MSIVNDTAREEGIKGSWRNKNKEERRRKKSKEKKMEGRRVTSRVLKEMTSGVRKCLRNESNTSRTAFSEVGLGRSEGTEMRMEGMKEWGEEEEEEGERGGGRKRERERKREKEKKRE